MMVSLIFLEGLDDEAWVEAMEEQEEEEDDDDDDDDDDDENEDGDHLIKMRWINVMLLPSGKPTCIGRIQNNILDRISQLH
ncbi:hypothetical protein Tco_0970121 [Tanacetum coccineum]